TYGHCLLIRLVELRGDVWQMHRIRQVAVGPTRERPGTIRRLITALLSLLRRPRSGSRPEDGRRPLVLPIAREREVAVHLIHPGLTLGFDSGGLPGMSRVRRSVCGVS